MGFDKASIVVAGIPAAQRIAGELSGVAEPVVEVGRGISGISAVADEEPGSGPLAATVTGHGVLRAAGHDGPVLVLACDLPLLTSAGLSALVNWPGDDSVVPVIGGRAQTLCARWSGRDLAAAAQFVAAGRRSMRSLLGQPGIVLVDETGWPPGVAGEFRDVDTPGDLERLGIRS